MALNSGGQRGRAQGSMQASWSHGSSRTLLSSSSACPRPYSAPVALLLALQLLLAALGPQPASAAALWSCPEPAPEAVCQLQPPGSTVPNPCDPTCASFFNCHTLVSDGNTTTTASSLGRCPTGLVYDSMRGRCGSAEGVLGCPRALQVPSSCPQDVQQFCKGMPQGLYPDLCRLWDCNAFVRWEVGLGMAGP